MTEIAPRSRLAYLAATIAVIGIGLVWRRADLGLPFFLWKYGGSGLWGTMVYLLVRAAGPQLQIRTSVAIAVAIAFAVEFSRLYHTDWLDKFRLTLAGALLLGRLFSLWNVVAYAAGIAAGAWADAAIPLRRTGSPRAP